MRDLFGLLKALLDLFVTLTPPTRAAVVQPMITAILLLMLYAGWNIRNEGDVTTGLRVAFLDTRASKALHESDLQAAMIRAEIYQAAESNRLIDELMRALLHRSTRAARVRLGVIHNGVTGVTGIGLLRYDMVNAVAAPGHTPGPQSQNDSLADWGPFLSGLLAGQCQFLHVDGLREGNTRTRLQEMGGQAMLTCPVTSVQGTLLGSLFVIWDAGEGAPSAAELEPLMTYAQQIGSQIAAALDLRVPVPRLSGMVR